MNYMSSYELWCKKVTDEKLSKQLKELKDDRKAIENAFYKELEFGTGGLRGEIGVGTNCLNIYTIAKVTQGIADCMKHYNQKSVAISYDSRINSDIFAHRVAEVFAHNGIKVYISRELMPTPFLSFAVRQNKTDMGVMVTASHNPAKYNGYKVYDNNGCQLTDDAANEMIGYINKIDPFAVVTDSFDSYVKSGLIKIIDDKMEEDYLDQVYARSLTSAEGLSVVYTPLNGTGYRLVPKILKRVGVSQLYTVSEQSYPDGNFTTCSYPNPEKPAALKLGLELAQQKGVDLLIATDPDADRMGIAVLDEGEYKLMSGNEVGVLFTDYIFSLKKANGTLPKVPVMVKTIVSTSLATRIAKDYGAEVHDVLTGFKYIGEIIYNLEQKGEQDRFVLGFEESYGYLSGSYVRDKDAVIASMLVAEMANYYKKQGKTLIQRINELYETYGKYEHKLISFEYLGADGNAKMKRLLENLRQKPLTVIGKKPVVNTIDYLTQTHLKLPKANVLSYEAADGTKLIVRPSGTEPLIKMYLTVCQNPAQNAIDLQDMQAQLKELFK